MNMKVGVIGAGAVGSACLLSMIVRKCAREIVVLNRDRKRAKAVATDLQYGAPLSPQPVDIRGGDYSDLAGAALVIITAGVHEKSGSGQDGNEPAGRQQVVDRHVRIFK